MQTRPSVVKKNSIQPEHEKQYEEIHSIHPNTTIYSLSIRSGQYRQSAGDWKKCIVF